ncbi:MAG: lipase family protein [Cocleimonas sp.]
MYKLSQSILFFLVSVLLAACGSSDSKNPLSNHQSGKLISAKQLASFSNTQIQVPEVDIKYPVKVYRLVYETKGVDGEFLNASGLLTIPQKSAQAKSPMMIYQHGVIYNNKAAPTENITIDSIGVLPGFIGFIVAAPDYIGYGESLGVMHPFSNAKVTASTSVDLLRAAKKFLKANNIATNNQLFLGGYSQGGGATLAVQRKIENELSDEFTVTASSAGAGAYNLSKDLIDTATQVLQNFEEFIVVRPSNIGLILKAMDDGYDLDLLDKIFQPEYAAIIERIYDGSHFPAFIDRELTHQGSELFNKAFLQRLINGEEQALVNAFKDNDILDWAPKAPTRLYHGRDDGWVKFDHAQTAYDTLTAKGATQLELVECVVNNGQGQSLPTNHANCFNPYLTFSYQFFLQFANDL